MPDVMVPEQLVHTSEVVVLLGNSWFAKCSGKQAAHTVSWRIRDNSGMGQSCMPQPPRQDQASSCPSGCSDCPHHTPQAGRDKVRCTLLSVLLLSLNRDVYILVIEER